MTKQEISQMIGGIEEFGYLLEDGVNVPEQDILLGGVIDEESGLAEKPWYRVTGAWQDGQSVMATAELIEE